MSISHDFSGLSNKEIARLFNETRKLAIQEKYGTPDESKPRNEKSRYHLAPDGSVCDCGDLLSHYPQDEGQNYIHSQGYVATAEPGEHIELTDAQRKIRFYESMPKHEVDRLSAPDQAALQDWREARTEEIAQQFRAARPSYNPVEENHLALLDYLNAEHLGRSGQVAPEETEELTLTLLARGCFTVETLCNAYDELSRQGRLTPRPGDVRRLDADELRRLSALASGCKTDLDYEQCLQKYLELSGIDLSWREAALDSIYSPVVEKAVFWIWEQAQETYTPTAERRAAIRKYLAGRFPTVKLLNAAWLAVQRQEERGGIEQEEQPAPKLRPEEAKIQQAQALANAIAAEQFKGM